MKVDNVTYTGASKAEEHYLGLKNQKNFTDEVVVVKGHTEGIDNIKKDGEISAMNDVYNSKNPPKNNGDKGE